MTASSPTAELAGRAVTEALGWQPAGVTRFKTGSGHYVFEVAAPDGGSVVARLGMPERRASMLEGTRLARRLVALDVPLPKLFAEGEIEGFPFVLMERLAGTDLGHVIGQLSDPQLRAIAEAVAAAQAATARLGPARRYGYAPTPESAPCASWSQVLERHLARSRGRMLSAGLFDPAVLDPVAARLAASKDLLDRQPALPFLHDTTTRNVLVDANGCFSGIVDVDDLCFGDPRYAPALTRAVLVGYGGPAQYVDYWMEAASHAADSLFQLYVALFLVDLMAEHGLVFNGNEVASAPEEREGLLRALAQTLSALPA